MLSLLEISYIDRNLYSTSKTSCQFYADQYNFVKFVSYCIEKKLVNNREQFHSKICCCCIIAVFLILKFVFSLYERNLADV